MKFLEPYEGLTTRRVVYIANYIINKSPELITILIKKVNKGMASKNKQVRSDAVVLSPILRLNNNQKLCNEESEKKIYNEKNLKPPETRFVIIANPRTGTNNLIDLLNSHPDILCHREVFHRDTVYLIDGTRDDLITKRNKNPINFLRELYEGCPNRACGFKIFMGHDDAVMQNVLRDTTIKKIILYRPNLLAVHSSEKIAVAENRWVDIKNCPVTRFHGLAFVHIPNTDTLFFHNELLRHFGMESSMKFFGPYGRERFSKLSSNYLNRSDYISGHISMKEIYDKGIDYLGITLLHDPVEGLLTKLKQTKVIESLDQKSHQFNDVSSFVERMKKNGQFNMQCWYLSGSHKFENAIDMIHRHCLYPAPIEYYEDFVKTIFDLFSINSTIKYNITNQEDLIKFNNSYISIIKPLIKDDLKLIEYLNKNYFKIKNRFINKAEKVFSKDKIYSKKKSHTKVIFDRTEFENFMIANEKYFKYAIDLLNKTNQHYLFLTYEDYLNEDLLRRIFPFLDLKQPEYIKSRMNKMNSSNILSRFKNLEDVRLYLKEAGKLHWAHEGFMLWR